MVFRIVFSALLVVLWESSSLAGSTIDEDQLNLRNVGYGFPGWPQGQLLEIRSPLLSTPLGLVYISKSGKDDKGNLLTLTRDLVFLPFQMVGAIFSGPKSENNIFDTKGRLIANLFQSKQGNCTLWTILQKRFYGDGSNEQANVYLSIKRLEIGAGDRIVSIEASGAPRSFVKSDFTYTKCAKDQYKDCPEYTGEQYSLVRQWPLGGSDLRALSLLPSTAFKIRYVFDSHTQIEEIKDGASVAKVYSSCS